MGRKEGIGHCQGSLLHLKPKPYGYSCVSAYVHITPSYMQIIFSWHAVLSFHKTTWARGLLVILNAVCFLCCFIKQHILEYYYDSKFLPLRYSINNNIFWVYFLPLQLLWVLGTVAGKLWTKDLAVVLAEEYAREEPWLDFAILPLALQWQLWNSYWMNWAAVWFDCSFRESVPLTSAELLFYCYLWQLFPSKSQLLSLWQPYPPEMILPPFFCQRRNIVIRGNNLPSDLFCFIMPWSRSTLGIFN